MGIFDIFILFAHTRANSGIQRIPNMADGYIVYTRYTIGRARLAFKPSGRASKGILHTNDMAI